jgi:hypothetical protein
MSGRDNFILELVYFAVGCAALGIVFAFTLVFVLQYLGIDVYKHMFLLLIPLVLSISLNIAIIELYGKYKRRKSKH